MCGPRDNYEDIRKRINYNHKWIDCDFIHKLALSVQNAPFDLCELTSVHRLVDRSVNSPIKQFTNTSESA